MSVAEAEAKPVQRFGQITLEDMRSNELLTRTVLPLVRDACKHSRGRFNVDLVTEGLTRGVFQLWGVMTPPATLDAIAVTTLNGDAFEILMLGPNADDVFPHLGKMTVLARGMGAKRMRMMGPGYWKDALPGFGETEWIPVARVYEREL